MQSEINKKIQDKIKQRLSIRKRRGFVRMTGSFFSHFFIIAIPGLALFFSVFLSWQVSNFQFSTNSAKASFVESASDNLYTKMLINYDELPKNKQLPIEYIKQIYPLSCEAASLEMALKFYGIETTQDELLKLFGNSEPKELQQVGSRYIWGDPDKAFVGDVKGWFTGEKDGVVSLKYATGWGINNGPVAAVARKFKPESRAITNANIDQVILALNEDKPVIWWHKRDDIFNESLTVFTPEGKQMKYTQMHVALISGFKISEVNSITFTIKDPFYGEFEINQEDFLRQWNRHKNQIVIVG